MTVLTERAGGQIFSIPDEVNRVPIPSLAVTPPAVETTWRGDVGWGDVAWGLIGLSAVALGLGQEQNATRTNVLVDAHGVPLPPKIEQRIYSRTESEQMRDTGIIYMSQGQSYPVAR